VEDPEVSAFVYQVYAAYYLQYNDPERAVSRLEQALEYLPKKGAERARTLFILAQCLESLGRASEAIDRYQQVVALRTPYEMEFYAKIKQAMAFDRRGGNSAPIVLLLEEMLADDKNEIYQDQIYYALAVLALEERRRDDTFGLLKSSLAANSDNTRQRMKSYLMLGDLYMDELDYLNAQAYYDSARTFMDDDHERFDEVDALAESLSDLVANLKVIEEQDSLLALCDLGEDERRARIREIREQLEAEAEARRKALEAAIAAEADAAGDAGTGMFWPYNAQLRVSGRRNFKDYWGDRPLEDHWRRSNKLQIIFTEEAPVDSAATADSGEPAAVQSGGLASEEEMFASLPCGEAARDSSEAKIAQAYYQAGIVYKEQLDDPENAIESWKSLVYRFEESAVHPTAYYQLYRTYLQREVEENFSSPFCEDCNSEFWAARVVERYPDSEWAILVENPDYADKEEVRRQTERAAYEALLARYYAKAYVEVMRETERIIAAEPENYYLCKHRILRAQAFAGSISGTGADRGQYFQALNDVIKGCPDTEEATFAQELLNLLGAPREKEPEAVVVEETPDEELFVHKPYLEHYFAIVVPVGRGNVESVRAKVADFNTKFYRSESLRVTANLIDKNHQIILVKSFKRQDYSLDYYTTFTTNTAELAALNTSGYPMFVITSENYVNLFRSKKIDAYIEFFNAKYLTEGR
jgi:tetratricopeptide (TPR) repeat protein